MSEVDSSKNSDEDFFSFHKVLLEQLQNELNAVQGKIPDRLYHYTNAKAFMDILQTNELWASNALFLNDAEEIETGLSIYRGIIEGSKQAKGITHSPRVQELFQASEVHAYMLGQSAVFVCCLSAVGNRLSQWRAYSRNGTGYSIEFDTAYLNVWFDKYRFPLLKVLYKPEEQSKLVLNTFVSFAVHIDSLSNSVWERDKSRLLEFFTNWIHHLLVSLKNAAFSEEEEWRLACGDWDVEPPKYSYCRQW